MAGAEAESASPRPITSRIPPRGQLPNGRAAAGTLTTSTATARRRHGRRDSLCFVAAVEPATQRPAHLLGLGRSAGRGLSIAATSAGKRLGRVERSGRQPCWSGSCSAGESAVERPDAGEHLVQHDAEAEESAAAMRLLPVSCSGAMYGSVPRPCPSRSARSGCSRAGDPEVEEPHPAVLADQDVGRLDIAMDHAAPRALRRGRRRASRAISAASR